MIVVGSCYFLLTLLIPYDPNIDFVFPLIGRVSLACENQAGGSWGTTTEKVLILHVNIL